jgi:putative nucleotidyltransferase with HDIG domain
MEVANRPDSAVCDLKEVIEREPALSGRILRWVNSSACATRTQITSLQQAIAYLGLKQIRNLAVRASVGELFKKDAALGTYRRSELWRHMVSVGICARLIAIRRNVENPEDAFLAGLLHDIGIVLEDRYAHDDFRAVMQSLAGNKTLAAAERTHFGFDHTTLGEHVAKRWGFPDTLTAAIRFHHLSAGYVGEAVDVVRCVEVANWIATAGGIPSVGLSLVDLPKAALAALWLTRRDAETLADGLHKELVQNGGLFQV